MEFKSLNNTRYIYDNNLGISIPVFREYSPRPGQDMARNDPGDATTGAQQGQILRSLERKYPLITRSVLDAPKGVIDETVIKNEILKNGLHQMTLGVTEDCNLRCKYCIFSHNYEYTRSFSRKKMSFETAKKALDQYLSLLHQGRQRNPLREPAIGFYGGEPLLNFPLVRQCVEYVETMYPDSDLNFTITTNGTLLTDEIIDFLTAHSFSIAVSLDGPKEEHDRKRVYKNGSGTFEDAFGNIQKIMDRGYEKIHALAVFDWKTDLFAMDEFFARPDVPTLSNITMPNSTSGCTYYDQFTDEDYASFRAMWNKARAHYLENLNSKKEKFSVFDTLFGNNAYKSLFGSLTLVDQEIFLMPYTGSCIPGRKIFVTVDGVYHMCERVNETFPLGDIHEGLNFSRIAQVLNEYISNLDKCPECSIRKKCSKCFCAFITEKGFGKATEMCTNEVPEVKNSLSLAFTIGETSPEFFESFSYEYYEKIKKAVAVFEE